MPYFFYTIKLYNSVVTTGQYLFSEIETFAAKVAALVVKRIFVRRFYVFNEGSVPADRNVL